MKQRIITGEWDGKEIWRWETPEETFARINGVSPEVARLALALNESAHA